MKGHTTHWGYITYKGYDAPWQPLPPLPILSKLSVLSKTTKIGRRSGVTSAVALRRRGGLAAAAGIDLVHGAVEMHPLFEQRQLEMGHAVEPYVPTFLTTAVRRAPTPIHPDRIPG